MSPAGRFKDRPTNYVGITDVNGWRLKQYSITANGRQPDVTVGDAVDATLAAELPRPRNGDVAVGFLIVHTGAEAVWVLADLWAGDIVHQHTFTAPLDDPTRFERVLAGGPTACVWELPIHAHERDAFVNHMLDPTDGANTDAYLADVMAETNPSNIDLLVEFARAWAAGDVDALMAVMSDSPTYRASTGTGPGTDFVGAEQVRAGFAAVLEAEASTRRPAPPAGENLVFGNRGLSFWAYPTTAPDGSDTLVEGVDVWTFDGGRIAVKDAYRKSFPD